MSKLTDQLRAEGADMDGAMDRLCGDEELFASCFAYFLSDPAFSALSDAIDVGDSTAAFESAHALKGVAGNLGLTDVYDLCSALVEPLRGGGPVTEPLRQALQALLARRDALRALEG